MSPLPISLYFGVAWSSLSYCGMERETGFEPATNSLEGCDSTPELLPLGFKETRLVYNTSKLDPMVVAGYVGAGGVG